MQTKRAIEAFANDLLQLHEHQQKKIGLLTVVMIFLCQNRQFAKAVAKVHEDDSSVNLNSPVREWIVLMEHVLHDEHWTHDCKISAEVLTTNYIQCDVDDYSDTIWMWMTRLWLGLRQSSVDIRCV